MIHTPGSGLVVWPCLLRNSIQAVVVTFQDYHICKIVCSKFQRLQSYVGLKLDINFDSTLKLGVGTCIVCLGWRKSNAIFVGSYRLTCFFLKSLNSIEHLNSIDALLSLMTLKIIYQIFRRMTCREWGEDPGHTLYCYKLVTLVLHTLDLLFADSHGAVAAVQG